MITRHVGGLRTAPRDFLDVVVRVVGGLLAQRLDKRILPEFVRVGHSAAPQRRSHCA